MIRHPFAVSPTQHTTRQSQYYTPTDFESHLMLNSEFDLGKPLLVDESCALATPPATPIGVLLAPLPVFPFRLSMLSFSLSVSTATTATACMFMRDGRWSESWEGPEVGVAPGLYCRLDLESGETGIERDAQDHVNSL